MQFHTQLGNFAFSSIERMDKESDSGIKTTCHKRSKCDTCSQGKGTRTAQPKKVTGITSRLTELEELSAVISRAHQVTRRIRE